MSSETTQFEGNIDDSILGVNTGEEELTESEANTLLDHIIQSDAVAIRRIIPNPDYSKRRHEFVAFDDRWHSGQITETQRGCIVTERYKIRSGLTGVEKSQIDIVPFAKTPMPYWLSGLVTVGCPNHECVWVTVNEMLVPKHRTCAECGSELVVRE